MTPHANSDWDDADIIAALRKDEETRVEAIEVVHAIYGRAVCGNLRRQLPTLSSHELFEIWDDALLGLWNKARDGRLRANGSLFALLEQIAWCRAVDLLRRKSRWKDVGHRLEDVLDTVADRMQTDPAAFAGLLEEVRMAIQGLTPKRRIVWETYAEFGFEASLAEITAAVSRRLGQEISDTTVRKRLEAGRNVLRQSLTHQFSEWFADRFDSWLRQRFDEWSKRRFRACREEVTDEDDGDESDG